MNTLQHKILDDMIDDFLDTITQKYSTRYCNHQVTESKAQSINFMIRKKRGRLDQSEK